MPTTDNKQENLFSGKNFLLGIGSQRAGSTLLHKLLARGSKEIFMHPVKELHYFDSKFGIRAPKALKDFSKAQHNRAIQQFKLSSDLDEENLTKPQRCFTRTNRLLSRRAIGSINYQDLFRPCIMGHQWLGEITPEYMLMNEDQILNVRDVIRADRIVVVLMARNPARRYLSAFKLKLVYMQDLKSLNQQNPSDWLKQFKQQLRFDDGWNQCQNRYNLYQETASLWSKHFGDDFMLLSIDQLVHSTQQTLETLSKRTGFIYRREVIDSLMKDKVNDVGVSFDLDDEALELCEQRFGPASRKLDALMGHHLTL